MDDGSLNRLERKKEVACRSLLSAKTSYAISSENEDTLDRESHSITFGSLLDGDACSIERMSF